MTSSHGNYVCWEWQRDDRGFCPYMPEVSKNIEAAHSAGQGQFRVSPYSIDFTHMVQHKYGGKQATFLVV